MPRLPRTDRPPRLCAQSSALASLRRENSSSLLRLSDKGGADGGLEGREAREAALRCIELKLSLTQAEGERARLASRAAHAEEQLAQLQAYMTQHIAAHQKEVLGLRRQLALAASAVRVNGDRLVRDRGPESHHVRALADVETA